MRYKLSMFFVWIMRMVYIHSIRKTVYPLKSSSICTFLWSNTNHTWWILKFFFLLILWSITVGSISHRTTVLWKHSSDSRSTLIFYRYHYHKRFLSHHSIGIIYNRGVDTCSEEQFGREVERLVFPIYGVQKFIHSRSHTLTSTW